MIVLQYLWLVTGFYSQVGTSFNEELNQAHFSALEKACLTMSPHFCYSAATAILKDRDANAEKIQSNKETENWISNMKIASDKLKSIKAYSNIIDQTVQKIPQCTFLVDKKLSSIVSSEDFSCLVNNLLKFANWANRPPVQRNWTKSSETPRPLPQPFPCTRTIGRCELRLPLNKIELDSGFWKALYRTLCGRNEDNEKRIKRGENFIVNTHLNKDLKDITNSINKVVHFVNDANYNIISSTIGLRNIVDVLGNLYSLGVDVEALKAIKELALKIVLKFSRLQKTYTPIPISALIYSKQWNITSKDS